MYLKNKWAHIVLLLECSFSPEELKAYQNKYCIKLPNSDTSLPETVALMVIKKISNTKATKKKNSIIMWKV